MAAHISAEQSEQWCVLRRSASGSKLAIGLRKLGFKGVYVIFEEAMAATPKNTPLRSYNSANRFVPEKPKRRDMRRAMQSEAGVA